MRVGGLDYTYSAAPIPGMNCALQSPASGGTGFTPYSPPVYQCVQPPPAPVMAAPAAPAANINIAPSFQTAISPQISPNFVQTGAGSTGSVGAGTSMSAPTSQGAPSGTQSALDAIMAMMSKQAAVPSNPPPVSAPASQPISAPVAQAPSMPFSSSAPPLPSAPSEPVAAPSAAAAPAHESLIGKYLPYAAGAAVVLLGVVIYSMGGRKRRT